MAKLFYQGHGSFRITTDNNTVIYVDPYAGDGYDIPADLILVTHQHGDHNQCDLVTQKADCVIISNHESLIDGVHQNLEVKGIKIQAVQAYNKNHDIKECVGYIIEVDGIKIYAAGDTSQTEQMEKLSELMLDYALLPGDGYYNMSVEEAAKCARIIKAKHSIPIHLKPGALFDKETAEKFDVENRIIIEPNEEIDL